MNLPTVPDKNFDLLLVVGRHTGAFSGIWVYCLQVIEGVLLNSELTIRCVVGVPPAGDGRFRSPIDQLALRFPGRLTVDYLAAPFGSRRLGLATDILRIWFRSVIGTYKPRLVHSLAGQVAFVANAKSIVTLHDIFQAYPPVKLSGLYYWLRTRFYRYQYSLTLPKAALAVTLSDLVEKQFNDHFPNTVKIKVVTPPAKILTTSEFKASRREPYFVAFASDDPRKNISTLLDAFNDFIKDSRASEIMLCIVVSGSRLLESLRSQVYQLGIEHRVRFDIGLSDSALSDLIKKSSGLAFVSLGEGFGYPIYEALSLGTPVLGPQNLLTKELSDVFNAAKIEPYINCDCSLKSEIASGLGRLLDSAQSIEANKLYQITNQYMSELCFGKRIVETYKELLRES